MKDWEKKVRSWAWEKLVFLADRISPDDAFRHASGLSVYLEEGVGWVLSRNGKGIPVWYYGPDYDKAYEVIDERERQEAMKAHPASGITDDNVTLKISSTLSDEQVERIAKDALWWQLAQR